MSASSLVDSFSISDPVLDWQPLDCAGQQPSVPWMHWLADPGSLTARLKSLSDNDFAVQVLAEEWRQLPDAQLRGCFGPLDENHRFWSRRVALCGQGSAWVLAHTLIPAFSLQGELAELIRLAERPLGEYLFNHPDLLRSGLDITPVAQAWARRSVFYLAHKPIMVAECFLPALLHATGEAHPLPATAVP